MGGSTFIELPEQIKKKSSILNIQNRSDSDCLRYCIIADQHRKEGIKHRNPQSPACYKPFSDQVNMKGVDTPVPLGQVL